MTIVERIDELARKNGTNLKNIEKETGLGNGTIRRWDASSPSIDRLLKVADFLHSSLDYIVKGEVPSGNSDQDTGADGGLSSLSPDELELVLNYRECPEQYRKNIRERAEKLSIQSLNEGSEPADAPEQRRMVK